MNFLRHRQPAQNLPEWLDVATRDLAPSAQARVRGEIEAQVAQAVVAARAAGLDDAAAHAAALAKLGDAQAAARRYRKLYYTAPEAGLVAGIIGIFQHRAWLVLSSLVPCLLILLLADEAKAVLFLGPLWWLAVVGFQMTLVAGMVWASRGAVRQPTTLAAQRQILWLFALPWFGLAAFAILLGLAVPIPAPKAGLELPPAFVMAFVSAIVGCQVLVLRNRLRTAGPVEVEPLRRPWIYSWVALARGDWRGAFYPRPAADLADWLDLATWELEPAAQARIRAEIEAHFADALAAHRASGLTDTVSHAAALADLGQPQVAARRFRQQCLTKREGKTAQGMQSMARSKIMLAVHCFWFVPLLMLAEILWFVSKGASTGFRWVSAGFMGGNLVIAGLFLYTGIAAYRAAHRATTPTGQRRIMFLAALDRLGLCACFPLVPTAALLAIVGMVDSIAVGTKAAALRHHLPAAAPSDFDIVYLFIASLSDAQYRAIMLTFLFHAALIVIMAFSSVNIFRLQKKIGALANGHGGNGQGNHG